ncbi:MAG: hypothetical protein WCC01_01115 [Acidimicrobiia bacterium]
MCDTLNFVSGAVMLVNRGIAATNNAGGPMAHAEQLNTRPGARVRRSSIRIWMSGRLESGAVPDEEEIPNGATS